jgi:hypothetical protein
MFNEHICKNPQWNNGKPDSTAYKKTSCNMIELTSFQWYRDGSKYANH